ncbi:DUF3347 domain-containing protein [Thermophagus xiamenensis]|uniref:DUF3347 domain-containing protein n=1 Tax=Thermophagus xiamenensis TaxID=385682 RepID=A0A1I2FU74_9BACT|nr:DUF3347 domain-containing protein [Thermophagus xiamenensis]SFF08378.1 Protein of unknown function [Thermophagus xiamenensis]
MNTKVRFMVLMTLSFALIIPSCVGSDKQKEKVSESIPSDKRSMPVSKALDAEKETNKMHKQHNSLAENFSHKDIVILDQPYQLSENAKTKMEKIIDAYLQLKDALVKEDIDEVNKMVGVMTEKVSAVVPSQLEGKGFDTWQNHKILYEAKLKEMQHISGLENKLSYFSHISEIMYCTIKSFDLKSGNLFAIFCPMALNKKGAYWISDRKIFHNPYMGGELHRCEEIKEQL